MGYLFRFFKKGLILLTIVVSVMVLTLIVACVAYGASGIKSHQWIAYFWGIGDDNKFPIVFWLSLIFSCVLFPLVFNLVYVMCKVSSVRKVLKTKLLTNYSKKYFPFWLINNMYCKNMGSHYGKYLDEAAIKDLLEYYHFHKKGGHI